MDYVDGVVVAVPEQHRVAYQAAAVTISGLFIEFGALEVVDCWRHFLSINLDRHFSRSLLPISLTADLL